MIPKIIHYCWFGGNPKPKLVQKCMSSWRRHCGDFDIIEWNESNIDLSSCPVYVQQAYALKRWAFVTDYVRLKVVYDFGGVYLDTDVELIKRLASLLDNKAFFGFEDGKHIATGLGFGAEKNTPILKELMQDYEGIPFVSPEGTIDETTCPVRNTKVFLRHGLLQDNSEQLLDGEIRILPKEYLSPIDYGTGKKTISRQTIAIHHFAASWKTEEQRNSHRHKVRIMKLKDGLDYFIHTPNRLLRRVLGDHHYNQLKKRFKG